MADPAHVPHFLRRSARRQHEQDVLEPSVRLWLLRILHSLGGHKDWVQKTAY